ncbi:TPA: hypothetical protein ACIYYU_004291 [Escherichia coli]
MFTEEQKIRAIELYFKYGKKLAPVVRELGYPSKRNWLVAGITDPLQSVIVVSIAIALNLVVEAIILWSISI